MPNGRLFQLEIVAGKKKSTYMNHNLLCNSHITEHSVFKLIEGINTRKSSGPDGIPGKLLQSQAKELASVLRFIFEQSLLTGDLPTDWTRANVAPVFKKGSKLQAVNYRPVSLTCITCKLFEHIICRHVLGHLEA